MVCYALFSCNYQQEHDPICFVLSLTVREYVKYVSRYTMIINQNRSLAVKSFLTKRAKYFFCCLDILLTANKNILWVISLCIVTFNKRTRKSWQFLQPQPYYAVYIYFFVKFAADFVECKIVKPAIYFVNIMRNHKYVPNICWIIKLSISSCCRTVTWFVFLWETSANIKDCIIRFELFISTCFVQMVADIYKSMGNSLLLRLPGI